MDKGPLGVHEVKLVIKPGPGLGDGGGVGEHADSAGDLGHIRPWHHSRGLVVDSDLTKVSINALFQLFLCKS